MSAVSVTFSRTLSRTCHLISTAFVIAAFVSAASLSFAIAVDGADGGNATLVAIWSSAVAPLLPVLVSFLAMDVWSDERRTKRVDMLLSIAVRERDYVFGKYAGICLVSCIAVVLSLVGLMVPLAIMAPAAVSGVGTLPFLSALFALFLQAAVWSAAAAFVSIVFARPAAAVVASLVITVAVPRGVWKAFSMWYSRETSTLGEMPLDAHVFDFANGIISLDVIAAYLIVICLFLFLSSKALVSLRFRGSGARHWRLGAITASVLAIVVAVSAIMLVSKLGAYVDLPDFGERQLSPRIRHMLEEASGNVVATCFMSRQKDEFKNAAQTLRMLKKASDRLGGVKFSVRYVDPAWDPRMAERLVHSGAKEDSLVFERGRRQVSVPVGEVLSDGVIAAALQQLLIPPQRREICWTHGHGEIAFDDYGPWGMSDIARELSREGYSNVRIDLSAEGRIPTDCALVVIAGAKDDFSRAELGRMEMYLKSGGRVLVLSSQPDQGGVMSILPSWGIRSAHQPMAGLSTLSGSDVIVSDFSEHVVTSPLRGSRIVLEKPLSFVSSAMERGGGVDKLDCHLLAKVGSSAVAVAIERGSGIGSDLAIRPTRMVVIGDAGFAVNSCLAARANANRDFFLNAVAYLSGTDAMIADGRRIGVFSSGMDRAAYRSFVLVTALAVPLAVYLMIMAFVIHKRRRG